MKTPKRRPRAKRVEVEDEAEKEPEWRTPTNAREAMEDYLEFLAWHSRTRDRPSLPTKEIKGPGLRPNELFINTLYVPKDRSGASRMSYVERAVMSCRAKAASGKVSAAETLIDMFFDSKKEGDLQPAQPTYKSK
jgi:hypothetical protein